MRFNSIHRHYLAGSIIACCLLVLGYVSIFSNRSDMTMLKLAYLSMAVAVLFWYWSRFNFYRSRFVVLYEGELQVNIDHEKYVIKLEDLDGIFVLRHKSLFKIYRVIHLFTIEDDYFYFTSNISQFDKLKQSLLLLYGNKYNERVESCSINFVVNRDNVYRLFWGDHHEVCEIDDEGKNQNRQVHYI